MLQPKRFLFALMVVLVAVAGSGRNSVYKATIGAPKPDTCLHRPLPAHVAPLLYRGQPPSRLGLSVKSFLGNSELLPASMIPIQFKNPKDLGVGKLLVASRGLGDPAFAGTVILLIHYDENGVVGLVLNRRTEVPLSQVLDLEAAKDLSDPLYLGGPVEPTAVLGLFQSANKVNRAEKLFGQVYLISDRAQFEQTLSTRPGQSVFRVFLGYAGWTQDQLRAEVQLGGWFVFPADATTVFDSHPDSLWLQMIEKTELQMAMAQASQARGS